MIKLLAKNAEDRYQTAAGVEADLQRCLREWEAHRRIEVFRLGAQDAPELVLVSGYSGIGKSSVVNELHKVLVPPRGLFASERGICVSCSFRKQPGPKDS